MKKNEAWHAGFITPGLSENEVYEEASKTCFLVQCCLLLLLVYCLIFFLQLATKQTNGVVAAPSPSLRPFSREGPKQMVNPAIRVFHFAVTATLPPSFPSCYVYIAAAALLARIMLAVEESNLATNRKEEEKASLPGTTITN